MFLIFLFRQCCRALLLIYARAPFIDCRNFRLSVSARIHFCAARCSCKCRIPRILRALSSCPPASSLLVGRFLNQRSNQLNLQSTTPSRVLPLSQGFLLLYLLLILSYSFVLFSLLMLLFINV